MILYTPPNSARSDGEQIRSLADVVGGNAPGRNSDADITLFESQGLAVQDITTGIRIYQLALEKGIGQRDCLACPDAISLTQSLHIRIPDNLAVSGHQRTLI